MSNETPPTARPPSSKPEAGARILIVDDDRPTREMLATLLVREGYVIELCEDGEAAISRVAQGGIDLVLLDVVLPKLSGAETCRMLKSMAQGVFLPIIFVTSRNEASNRAEGLRLGADDYLGKPFDPEELSARVAGMLRIRRLMGGLSEERDRLLKRAVHDELTGLPNRKHFEGRLAEERKRAERHHEPFACVLVDIEGATTRSSERAPSFFDRLVGRCANALKRSVREGDVLARHDDAVFSAILPHTHFTGAIAACDRMMRDVAAVMGDPDDALLGISMGASLFPSRDGKSAESLLTAAETALEEARRAGGGRICILHQRRYIYTPGGQRSERPPPTSHPSEPPPSR